MMKEDTGAHGRAPARNRNRMFLLRGDAPARGLFFLLLFLWTSKEKVDSKHKIILNESKQRVAEMVLRAHFRKKGALTAI